MECKGVLCLGGKALTFQLVKTNEGKRFDRYLWLALHLILSLKNT